MSTNRRRTAPRLEKNAMTEALLVAYDGPTAANAVVTTAARLEVTHEHTCACEEPDT